MFEDTTKIELFNDMDIIQDDTVILDRLNYFLEEIGKPAYHNLEEIGKPPYSDIAYHNYVFKLKYISEYKYI